MRAFFILARLAVAVLTAAAVAPPALADCYSAYQSCLDQTQSIFDNCAARCGYFDRGCAAFCQQQWQMNGQTCVSRGNRCLVLNQYQNGYSDPNGAVYGSPAGYPPPGDANVPPSANYIQVPGGNVAQPPAQYPTVSGGYVAPQPGYVPAPSVGAPSGNARAPGSYVPPGGYVSAPGTYAQPQPVPQPTIVCPNAAAISMYKMGPMGGGRTAVARSPKSGFGC